MFRAPPPFTIEPAQPTMTVDGVPVYADAAPAPEAPALEVVVPAPERPRRPRDRFMAGFCRSYVAFIERDLRRRAEIQQESVKDLRQLVLDVVDRRHEEQRLPPEEKMRAYLRGIIRKVLGHRLRRRRLEVDGEANLDAVPDEARSPESILRLAEHAGKLERYLAELPPAEAEVIECVDLLGMSVADAAEELQVSYDRAWRRYQRARARLEDRARASSEAEEARLRRGQPG